MSILRLHASTRAGASSPTTAGKSDGHDLYYELFEEVKQIAESERHARDRESRTKTKSAAGKDATRTEAKLETKSHRRVSRRRAMETDDF